MAFRQPRLDYSTSDAISELAAMILQMGMQGQASAREHERDLVMLSEKAAFEEGMQKRRLAHDTKVNELNILAQEHQFQRARLAEAEEKLTTEGYSLPYAQQTSSYGALVSNTVEGYTNHIDELEKRILQVNDERSKIVAGGAFAERMEADFAGATKASEDAAWKDYMLEGGFEVDEKGDIIGTSEIAKMMAEISPEERGRLKSANYRRAFLEGRRNVKDAKELHKQDVDLALVKTQQEGADIALRNGEMELATKHFENAQNIITDNMMEIGKATLSSLNLEGKGVNYLMMLEDPDDYVDTMNEFIESSPEIASDMQAIMDNFTLSKATGVDWSEAVVRAQAHAYEDFLEAKAIEDEIKAKGGDITKLPLTTETGKRYALLKKRVDQWKKAGMYNGGEVKLRRAYQVIKANEQIHSDRIKADAKLYKEMVEKGYSVNLEDFDASFYENMDESKRQDLKKAIAILNSLPQAPPIGGQQTADQGEFIRPRSAADKILNLQNWLLVGQYLGEDIAETLGYPVDLTDDLLYLLGFQTTEGGSWFGGGPMFGSEHIKEGMMYAPLRAMGFEVEPIHKKPQTIFKTVDKK